MAAAIPLGFALAGWLPSKEASIDRAAVVAWCNVAMAALVAVAIAFGVGRTQPPLLGVRLDAVTAAMLLLVSCVGAFIVRFSKNYLQGDVGRLRYVRWLMTVIATVTTLVIANNLLVMALAWTATGLALHHLLTYYNERIPALVAAHKKFLVSRLADLCMLVGLGLVYGSIGSLDLDIIATHVGTLAILPPSLHAAALLFAAAACLKSAQLPFHGWLIQVMEAPTPVSALLHAGVVNIGGFVLIRLAPVMVHAPAAQSLLVVVGATTAAIAALVTMTRVSIKVSLAWSTAAQMGFMLVQCGLGLWHLAMLHLIAHSLYKAHAFLSSGSTVHAWRVQSLTRGGVLLTTRRLLLSVTAIFVLLSGGVFAISEAGILNIEQHPAVPMVFLLLAFSLAPMVGTSFGSGAKMFFAVAVRSVGAVVLYFVWHVGATQFFNLPKESEPSVPRWAFVAAVFAALFAVQIAVQLRPNAAFVRRLHPWLFGGGYLDERFTRITFHLWPPRRSNQAVFGKASSQEASS